MTSRRTVQRLLGLLWLIDGLLQLKPDMFSHLFVTQVLLPVTVGQPHWVQALILWEAHALSGHTTLFNAGLALAQLALGLALLGNFYIRQTLVLSIVWSLSVWVFGEGFGGLFSGQALVLTGAPGAALLYGLVSVAVWPARGESDATWSAHGVRFAQLALAAISLLGFVLHLQPQYLLHNGLDQAITVPWLSSWIGNQAEAYSLLLGLMELLTAVLFISKRKLSVAAGVTIGLGLLFWGIGQSFGQLFTPLATDPNSGPLLVLLALCAYPALTRPSRQYHTLHHASF